MDEHQASRTFHSPPSNRYGYGRGSNRDHKSCLCAPSRRVARLRNVAARRRNACERERMIYRAARSAISRDVKAAYILRDTRARARVLRCYADRRRTRRLENT